MSSDLLRLIRWYKAVQNTSMACYLNFHLSLQQYSCIRAFLNEASLPNMGSRKEFGRECATVLGVQIPSSQNLLSQRKPPICSRHTCVGSVSGTVSHLEHQHCGVWKLMSLFSELLNQFLIFYKSQFLWSSFFVQASFWGTSSESESVAATSRKHHRLQDHVSG